MKYSYLLISFVLICFVGNTQIISQFSWDSNPVTSADVGPDATSVSTSATSSINGVAGTNGLNAALPKRDLEFTIPTVSGIFDVAGIDVCFDFQRDESIGTFFERGNGLVIDGCNQLSVSYRVDNGAGGFNTVNSGNAYNIPNDAIFRRYRFYYLPVTGYGSLLVDGVEVWSNDGPDNRDMIWTGAGDIVIGSGMDGSGSNRTFLDNLVIGSVTFSALPIELLSFTAECSIDEIVRLNWQTASELNNDYFTIQKSLDGTEWENIAIVDGAGSSSVVLNYEILDKDPYLGLSYYRLMQTDFDGGFCYSNIEKVFVKSSKSKVSIYPNPTISVTGIEASEQELESITIYNALGENVSNNTIITKVSNTKYIINLSELGTGIYFIKTKTDVNKIYKK